MAATNLVSEEWRWFSKRRTDYLLAASGVAALTSILVPLGGQINSTIAGFAFLLESVAWRMFITAGSLPRRLRGWRMIYRDRGVSGCWSFCAG